MNNNSKEKDGCNILNNKRLNKGTAFTALEREQNNLRGLLPATISTQEVQMVRALENCRRKTYDIERYIFLMSLLERNERLFYKLVIENIEELAPIIYTPTVGQACQEFAHIFRQARGFYITRNDLGHIKEMLSNWPVDDVRLIVVTDGQRILGLGDLGANGIGIPIGKLALYTACAGIPPEQCMPVMLDVGTNNKTLRDDPLYLGVKEARLNGEVYQSLVDEFITALQVVYPQVLIQFEDFLTPDAYQHLQHFRNKVRCFNDDIQGTAAMALAGVLASCLITGTSFTDLRILFLGAGSAATGIADLIISALCAKGLTEEQAYSRLWLVDHSGLIISSREKIAANKKPYARNESPANFVETIHRAQPHVLIGATGTPSTFNEEVIRLMADINEQPVIFALSNPTSNSECTALEAYKWSDGRAIFASGSKFPPVDYAGKIHQPGQGNNVYIFPGVGLGVLACNARLVTDEMFLDAAKVLADCIDKSDLQKGSVYPPLSQIRSISMQIAIAVVKRAYAQRLAEEPEPDSIENMVANLMYDPAY